MQMKKNEKGITLIALAVTFIVMMIIALITTYSGVSAIQDAKQKRLRTELETVQHAVLERYTKYEFFKDTSYFVGTIVSNIDDIPEEYKTLVNSQKLNTYITTIPSEERYYKLDKEALEKLDLKEPNFNYIVCYKTGEVMNIDVTTDSQGNSLYISFE